MALKRVVQWVQHPKLSRSVQPVTITNIAGAKWFRPRFRRGCSATRSRPPAIAAVARAAVGPTLGPTPLSGRGCLVDYLTKRGRI